MTGAPAVICTDKATTYLKRLGYNVVRIPQEEIKPLDLVGRQNKETVWLGGIEELIKAPTGLPAVEENLQASDVNGQESSKLKLGIGANVLGAVIGAMGGNLGVNTSYTNARTISFVFRDVLTDRCAPLKIGDFLREAEVDSVNPVLQEYVLGNGELFVITQTLKADGMTVKYERRGGAAAKVEVPALGDLVGLDVGVEQDSKSAGMVSYKGSKKLVFGFRCFAVGVLDGDLRLTTSAAGAVPLAAGEATEEQKLAEESAILSDENAGLLDLGLANDA